MTMTVSIGLEGFTNHDRAASEKLLRAIVKCGATTLVREVLSSHSKLVETPIAEVLEAGTVGGKIKLRVLPAEEAKPILKDLRAFARKQGTYATFPYDDPCFSGYAVNVQDLALVADGPSPPPDRVALGLDRKLRIIDLDVSLRNWRAADGQIGIAKRLHLLAKRHRLVVHSA